MTDNYFTPLFWNAVLLTLAGLFMTVFKAVQL